LSIEKGMHRVYQSFSLPDAGPGQARFIQWAVSRYKHVAFLSSSSFSNDPYSQIDAVLAAGNYADICQGENASAFDELKKLTDQYKDWIFGFLSYDLKNQLENLQSHNPDGIGMPLMHFFIPRVLIFFRGNNIEIGLPDQTKDDETHQSIYDALTRFTISSQRKNSTRIKHRVTEPEYIGRVNKIKEHIQKGDIYETNFCIEFYDDQAEIDPVESFVRLNQNNPAPFSCFYRYHDRYLISSSPERFLAKRGKTLISQPIKGTIRRGQTHEEDQQLKDKLFNDPKERSENIMIVDLVRNDLSITAQKGSVRIKELFGIYSYKHVHQMISTIESTLGDDIHFVDALKTCFPMGSMTGAPKIKAMQIIEENESTCRGLYSGAVGYITPEHDFDFNVIIRSILYNETAKYLSFMAGSAITIGSDPQKEYHECLLKASSLAQTLNSLL
jgi:para-aminobenzoate synthetase component I